MRFAASILAAALAVAVPAAAFPKAPDVVETSFVSADGAKTLQESIIIDAPVALLWKAFTDPVEFRRWSAPVAAAIDLRVGGSLEASYAPGAKLGDPDNIRHRIITFLPERLIVYQNIQAPHGLPHAEAFQRTVTVLQYEPLAADRTRVTLSSTGWGADPDSAALYEFFRTDNAELLEKMRSTYEPGR
jgi:uncharacterized protein YndB with AHSA1/START domain